MKTLNMDKDKNKGLADNQDGEFILNESGTSVSIDADREFPEDKDVTVTEDEDEHSANDQVNAHKNENQ